ncbi:MAG TPA: hypothetical protein VLD35_02630 [Caldimonas sp.]|nr:hypothetical protein [Caldimonas sp.]
MARSSCLLAVASLLVALPLGVAAQAAKPPPRLPPPTSQTTQIPGGLDTGTPAGSDSLQLGTPVTSNATGSRASLPSQSAAARAAARPKPIASSADCTKPLPDTGKAEPAPLPKPSVTGRKQAPPTKAPVAPGATRIDC